jgi:hypothetical protein
MMRMAEKVLSLRPSEVKGDYQGREKNIDNSSFYA